MTAFLVVELLAVSFVVGPWLSARSAAVRPSVRSWYLSADWFRGYTVALLFLESLVAVPLAIAGGLAVLPPSSGGSLLVLVCATFAIAVAIAHLRPPRLLPTWLIDEITAGHLPTPTRGWTDWFTFVLLELGAISGILLVVVFHESRT